MRMGQQRIALGALLLLLVVACAVRSIGFCGYFGSDDGQYALLAHRIAEGGSVLEGYDGPPVFPLRHGVVWPVAQSFRLFGVGESSMLAYNFALSIASVLLAFGLGRLWFGDRGGFVAALLMTAVPSELVYASLLTADLPMAFWAGFGVLMTGLALRSTSPWRKVAMGAAAGLCFAVAWLCKETVVYLVPFVVLWLAVAIRRDRSQLMALAGLGVASMGVFVAEVVTYGVLMEQPLFRFHEMERNAAMTSMHFFGENSPRGYASGEYLSRVWERLALNGPRDLLFHPEFAYLPALALLAVGYAAFRRLERFAVPGAWLACLLLLFNFGSTSLSSYSPLVVHTLQIYLLLLPSVVVFAGFIVSLLPEDLRLLTRKGLTGERFFWAGAMATLVCVVFLVQGIRGSTKTQCSPAERALAADLRDVPPQVPLYTDSRSASVLEFFFGYPAQPRARDFRAMKETELPPGSLVFFHPARADKLHSWYKYPLPSFYTSVPGTWKQVWAEEGAFLYQTPAVMNQAPGDTGQRQR